MFNEHNEKDITLKDDEGNPISRFDALRNALKEDYMLKSAYNYNKSLTDQIESDEITDLKDEKTKLTLNKQVQELRKSLDVGDSKLLVEKDLEGVIDNLANLRDQNIESNKLPGNIQGPIDEDTFKKGFNKNDVKDVLSNIGFNITNATDKKGKIIEGQFNVSAPGLDLKDVSGLQNKDLTNISQFFKRLVYSQVGINREKQDEIFTRLNKLIELKKL